MSNIPKGDAGGEEESQLGGYEIATTEEGRINNIYKCAKSTGA